MRELRKTADEVACSIRVSESLLESMQLIFKKEYGGQAVKGAGLKRRAPDDEAHCNGTHDAAKPAGAHDPFRSVCTGVSELTCAFDARVDAGAQSLLL